tara:strand:+ start:565 stop:1227 length:663 start_codon:yes stop_codon:yes gene_type:complete
MKNQYLIIPLLFFPLFLSGAFAHQTDSVGEYRIETDWKNKPIVSGESNAIIVYVSKMDKSKEAADQAFDSSKGIDGLRKTLKIQLVVGDDEQSITLPLQKTEISGMYESPITPTFIGWSQLNFIGTINDTTINLALHPLKVEESSSLEFPPVESTMVESGDFEREINDLRGDIRNLQETIDGLQEETETDDGIGGVTIIVAIGLGIAGIIIGVASLVKKK